MSAYVAAGQDRSMFRLDSPYLDRRIIVPEYLAYAGECSASADTGTEPVYRTVGLLYYLKRSMLFVSKRIVLVLELLRNIHVRIRSRQFLGHLKTVLHTFPDIAGVMNRPDFGTVMSHEFGAFLTH